MATYPALPQQLETKLTPTVGLKTVIMGNGAVRGRFSQAAPSYTLVVAHDNVTLAQRDVVLAFLVANRAAAFDLLLRESATTYTGCRFAEVKPVEWEPRPARKFRVTARILVPT
jgi:hypothetical protein